MKWIHPEHPGRALRLAYCLNLHPAETLEELERGIREVTLPLRARLARPGEAFGVGLYVPAAAAHELTQAGRGAELDALAGFLRDEGLDPFTYNAFPYGGFHRAGLKQRVFEPTWADAARLEYTLAVARLARELSVRVRDDALEGHLSISTHPGRFGPWAEGETHGAIDHFERVALELARIEQEGGPRIVLGLEAEPRASAGDTAAVADWLSRVRRERRRAREAALRWHLGTCLDACHAAVEFETPEAALADATREGAPLAKIQLSSALALRAPGANAPARARLLALSEERYLHQVTGRAGARFERALDLPELAAALETPAGAGWLACEEWRCHFHVPIDRESVGDEGLATTRAQADELLALALADPSRWGTEELHLEIETYTWDVLPGPARGPGALVDGLEREYRHVFARLAAAGWRRPA